MNSQKFGILHYAWTWFKDKPLVRTGKSHSEAIEKALLELNNKLNEQHNEQSNNNI